MQKYDKKEEKKKCDLAISFLFTYILVYFNRVWDSTYNDKTTHVLFSWKTKGFMVIVGVVRRIHVPHRKITSGSNHYKDVYKVYGFPL